MPLTKRQKLALKYYKNPKKVNRVIKKHIKKNKNVVYGGKAINSYLPKRLQRHTEDYDIFTETPARQQAIKAEQRLDKAYGGDLFFTKPAAHRGTHKVMNRVTGKEVADFTNPPGVVPFKTKKGIRFLTEPEIKKRIRKTLRDKSSAYRHAKDRDSLQRLQLKDKFKGQKKKKTKSVYRTDIPLMLPPKVRRLLK